MAEVDTMALMFERVTVRHLVDLRPDYAHIRRVRPDAWVFWRCSADPGKHRWHRPDKVVRQADGTLRVRLVHQDETEPSCVDVCGDDTILATRPSPGASMLEQTERAQMALDAAWRRHRFHVREDAGTVDVQWIDGPAIDLVLAQLSDRGAARTTVTWHQTAGGVLTQEVAGLLSELRGTVTEPGMDTLDRETAAVDAASIVFVLERIARDRGVTPRAQLGAMGISALAAIADVPLSS